MGFVVDILILIILILCVIFGYKKGLISTAFSLASVIVAAVIALALFNPVADIIIKNTTLDETIKETIIANFSTETVEPSEETSENLPDVIVNFLQDKSTELKNAGVEIVAENISQISVKALAFIGIFIIARIGLIIVEKVANLIAKLPVIKQFNEVGGIAMGLIKGVLIIYIVFAVLSLLMPIIQDQTMYIAINNSFIGKIMYNDNLLLKIIFNR